MTASSSRWQACSWKLQPSPVSEVIMTNDEPRESLDFMDIEKGCRTRLTDGELGGLLVCTNAVNTLKSLKLTHCFGITSAGLEPLRGSTVLERIDLSLVEQHESPVIEPKPAILAKRVVPILNSIIERDGSSLRLVQLPKTLRQEKSEKLNQFLQRYDQYLHGLRTVCSVSGCGGICEGTEDYPWVHKNGCECWFDSNGLDEYGMQSLTCYQCMRNYCASCFDNCRIDFCTCCEKNFCEDCSGCVAWCEGKKCNAAGQPQKTSCVACNEVKGCVACGEDFCSKCASMASCNLCNDHFCDKCPQHLYQCGDEGCGCKKVHCKSCIDGNFDRDGTGFYFCDDCTIPR